MTHRLDQEVASRGLAISRTRAAQLIKNGQVQVDGIPVHKPAEQVTPRMRITVTAQEPWVSRGAHKLISALDLFPSITVAGARCLDAGASTGGFTHVLLERGAAHVVAADVGHNQLAPSLGKHPDVSSYEGINLRYVRPGELGAAFEIIVADLSFISLTLVLEPLAQLSTDNADLLLMVKPQFEVGRHKLPRTGVVRDPQQRRDAVCSVLNASAKAGLETAGVARSGLAGQDGNAEFFLHLRPQRRRESVLGDRVGGVGTHTPDLESVDFSDQS